MEILCTKCGFELDPRTANVQTNLVQCPDCFAIHKLDVLLDRQPQTKELIETDNKPIYKEKYQEDNSIFENQKYELTRFENQFKSPPKGSRIDMFDTSSTLEITVPPRGFKLVDSFAVVFGIIWISFVAFWTIMVLTMGAWFMAFFSIPFWLVGIAMVSGISGQIFEKQIIEVDRYTLRITKQRLFTKKVYDFDLEDIDSIERDKVTLSNSFKNAKFNTGNTNRKQTLPVVKMGVKSVTFMEYMSDVEMNWGVMVLRQAIAKFSDRRL